TITFPYKPAPATTTYWSYLIGVLPYMEQQTLLDGLDLHNYWQDDPNATYLYNHEVPFLRCPSQSAGEVTFTDVPPSGTRAEQSNPRTHYMGVRGAKISCPAPPPTAPWPSNTYPMTPRCDQGGGIAMSGVITTTYDGTNYVPSHVNLKDVTDGSSHTFVVGE